MKEFKKKTSVELLDVLGSRIRFMKHDDADRMVTAGDAEWISPARLQRTPKAARHESPAGLTTADSERLAGIRNCSLEQLARLNPGVLQQLHTRRPHRTSW